MKKHFFPGPILLCCLAYLSCSTTPEKYFDVAVLNSNILFGFAGDGMIRQLESPSVKLSGNNNETVPMKRSEIVDMKIQAAEETLEKVESLKETEETKEMLKASQALYTYVLPVYKNEYLKLAGLYDNNAPEEQIQSAIKTIHDKYFAGYEELYNALISSGKTYAEKNDIKVNWGTQ